MAPPRLRLSRSLCSTKPTTSHRVAKTPSVHLACNALLPSNRGRVRSTSVRPRQSPCRKLLVCSTPSPQRTASIMPISSSTQSSTTNLSHPIAAPTTTMTMTTVMTPLTMHLLTRCAETNSVLCAGHVRQSASLPHPSVLCRPNS